MVGPTVRAACLASPAFTPLWPRRTAAPAAPFLPADMRAAQPISSTLYPSHPRQSGAGWLWLVVFLKETCGRDPRRGDAGGTGRLGAQTGRQSAVAWRHNNGSSVTPQQRQERCAVQLGAGRAALYSKLLQHIHYPRWRDWTGAARRPTAHSLQLIRRAHTNNNLVSPPSGRLAKHILLAHSPKP